MQTANWKGTTWLTQTLTLSLLGCRWRLTSAQGQAQGAQLAVS